MTSTRGEGSEGFALGGRHVRGALEGAHVPHVLVQGCDVPVADEGDAGPGILQPAAPLLGEVCQPLEFIGVVRVGEFAAVGHVQAPDRHRRGLPLLGGKDAGRVDGDAECAGFDDGRLTEGGLGGEVVTNLEDRQARGHGDAVPLVETVDCNVVAGLLKGLCWELVRAALDFLHGEHICVRALKEGDDAVDARADGVDVPGRKSHGVEPIGGSGERLRETRVKHARWV